MVKAKEAKKWKLITPDIMSEEDGNFVCSSSTLLEV